MKKLNILLSAVMLASVTAINCEIITLKQGNSKSAATICACVKCASKRAAKSVRDEAAKEIQENLSKNTKAVALEVKCDDKYMGIVFRNEDKAGYEIQIFNLDTKERLLYLIPAKQIRTFEFKKDSLVIKWTGFFRTQTTYTLDAKCKKCGTTSTGKITKRRAFYGYAPSL